MINQNYYSMHIAIVYIRANKPKNKRQTKLSRNTAFCTNLSHKVSVSSQFMCKC